MKLLSITRSMFSTRMSLPSLPYSTSYSDSYSEPVHIYIKPWHRTKHKTTVGLDTVYSAAYYLFNISVLYLSTTSVKSASTKWNILDKSPCFCRWWCVGTQATYCMNEINIGWIADEFSNIVSMYYSSGLGSNYCR